VEQGSPAGFPDAAALAALRAWYEGLPAREAAARYRALSLTRSMGCARRLNPCR
jgi:hypothetical protein